MTSRPLPTLAAACAAHPLAPAVLRQLGGGEDAIRTAIDAARHGADSGFRGFTYYKDTAAFYRQNRHHISEALRNLADDCGTSEPSALLRSFRSLRDVPDPMASLVDPESEDHDAVANALAWFALEEVGAAIIRLSEERTTP